MNTRTTTLTAAGAALALALTGCTGNEGAGGTSSTPPASQATTSSTAASASASQSESSASSSSSAPAASPSSAPEFEEIISARPSGAQMTQIKGFEAVQLLYKIQRQQFVEGSVDAEQLGVAVREPYLSKLVEQLEPIETADQSYSGESKVELLEAIAGGARSSKGEEIENATSQLLVCEDNTGVVVKDADGKRVSSGSVLRYQLTYLVTWDEVDGTWKVASREVMRDQDGDPLSC